MERFGWQGLVAHDGRIEAELTIADETWMRPVQSGYRPNWRVVGTTPSDPMEGPLVLNDATSAAPGSVVKVTIIPLVLDRWLRIVPGTALEMLDRRGRVVGTAVVTSVANVQVDPAS